MGEERKDLEWFDKEPDTDEEDTIELVPEESEDILKTRQAIEKRPDPQKYEDTLAILRASRASTGDKERDLKILRKAILAAIKKLKSKDD